MKFLYPDLWALVGDIVPFFQVSKVRRSQKTDESTWIRVFAAFDHALINLLLKIEEGCCISIETEASEPGVCNRPKIARLHTKLLLTEPIF